MLTGEIELARRIRRDNDVEPEFREQRVPEGQQLIEIQCKRNADGRAAFCDLIAAVFFQQLALDRIEIIGGLTDRIAERLFAAVACDIGMPAAE